MNLRTLIVAGLGARVRNIEQNIALECVNRVCNDPDSNAGAGEEEPTLVQTTFSLQFRVLMGEDQWPKATPSVTREYHEALAKAVEAHGAGKEDLICRMADLLLRKWMLSSKNIKGNLRETQRET